MNIFEEFNPIEVMGDYTRGGGQIEFYKRYSKLDEDTLKNIPYSYKDLENAFQHAYTAAKIAKNHGEDKTRWLGYWKEINSKNKEINNFGSRYYAFLDTNRDL